MKEIVGEDDYFRLFRIAAVGTIREDEKDEVETVDRQYERKSDRVVGDRSKSYRVGYKIY